MSFARAAALLAALLPLDTARDRSVAREKAFVVAARRLAGADVACLPCGPGASQPGSPLVLARATGEAVLGFLEGRAGCVRTSGIALSGEAPDPDGILVGREPLDRGSSYRVATTADFAALHRLEILRRDLPAPEEVSASLDAAREAAERARAQFPAPSPAPPVSREILSEGRRLRVERLVFESPLPSGVPENDRVPLRVFRPVPEARAGVLILPIWKGSGPLLEESLARALAAEGYLAAVLPLAYQFERSPPGVRSGSWTVSEDLERTASALRQSVGDARRAAGILLDEGIDPGGLGILGVSLGGLVGSVVYSLDERFSAGAFLLAGGGLADAVWASSRETARLRRALERRGITREDFAAIVAPFDPETHALAERRDGVLLVGGLEDPVVPPRNVERLWAAYGEPPLLWIAADHYAGLFLLPRILVRVQDHFSRRLRPAGR